MRRQSARLEADAPRERKRPPRRRQTLKKSLHHGRHQAQQTFKHAVTGIGQWFGVVGDPQQMEMARRAYHQSRETAHGGQKPLGARGMPQPHRQGKGERFAVDAIDFDDSSEDEEREFIEARKTNVDPLSLCREPTRAMARYREVVGRDMKHHRKHNKPGWFGGKGAGHISLPPSSSGLSHKSKAKPKKKHKLKRNETMIALQLQALPTFTPYFINTMTFVQFLVILCMCAHAYTTGQLATWGLSAQEKQCSLTTEPLCPELFNGTLDSGAISTTEVNLWLGPKRKYLLSVGAKFPPCMREDTGIRIKLAQERQSQCGVDLDDNTLQQNVCDAGNTGFSCCVLSNLRAGMTSEGECLALGGAWQKTALDENEFCDENDAILIVLRPCCIGFDSSCRLMTHDSCAFYDGVFHDDKQLCSETMCLGDTCKMERTAGLTQNQRLRNEPETPNQWERFIVPIFLHSGGIHFFLNMLIQWHAGRQIEKSAGFLRTFLIYWISGIGGNAVSGIFVPLQVDAGPSGAVYGLLGVLVVELFQSWQIIPKPLLELSKIVGIVMIALLVGTFPYIDNFGHVAGFCFGIVSAIIFLPYITFGKWDYARKKLLLMIAFPLLITMGILAFVFFYQVQNTEFCEWCSSVNCVEWTPLVDCSADLISVVNPNI